MTILLALLAAIIAGLLLFAKTRPDAFHVERQTNIQAPAEKVFTLINDLHSWTIWSPYEKLDPAMKKVFSGSPSGPGAKYAWEGNAKAGAGNIEITSTTPPSLVKIDLNMLKPFQGSNKVEFRVVPENNNTKVTWAMDGTNAYFVKVMSIFMNMDNMVGSQFSEGLANLKRIAEEQTSASSHSS